MSGLSDSQNGWISVTIEASDGSSESAFIVPQQQDIEVRIDGKVDEVAWQSVRRHTEFFVTDPDTLEKPKLETAWRLIYNDDGLYVAVECEQDADTLVERLSAPDYGFLNRDYVNFVLDTSGEGLYGYWFQLSLGGSRADGTIQAERQFSDSWNGAWRGKTSRTSTGWSAEFYVPWSIVSMPSVEGERQMGILMQRKIAYVDERIGFPPLPFTQPKYLSGFQPLILKDVSPKQQLSFVPQVSAFYDSIADEADEVAGLDVFWRPSTNLQFTGTFKPDFGFVEADDVIINLSAIETFFPEKRLFFLEGQEVFVPSDRASQYSYGTPVMLLHTRRIGHRPFLPELPDDATFDRDQFSLPTQLTAAAKATGQAGPLRYGVLSAFEEDTNFLGTRGEEEVVVTQFGRDFSVVRALLEKSSNGYQGVGFMSTFLDHPSVYASTHGIDAHYFSPEGKVRIDTQAVFSDIQGEDNGYGGFVEMTLAPYQGTTHQFVLESFDDKLNLNYLGYMPRNDFDQAVYRMRLRKYGTKWFKEASTRFSAGHARNGANEVIESDLSFRQEFTFFNQTQFRISAQFKADAYDDLNSFGNGSYLEEGTREFGIRYSSDSSKRFYYQLSTQYETESKEGDALSGGTYLVWRPLDYLTLNASLSYRQRDSWVLYQGGRQFTAFASESWSPRFAMDYFLSAQQHLRMDLQWRAVRARESGFYELNTESRKLVEVLDTNPNSASDFAISRLNMQVRYRWEVAPMSDLFIVYSKQAALPDALRYSFTDQLSHTLEHPVAEGVVLKVRHRLGT